LSEKEILAEAEEERGTRITSVEFDEDDFEYIAKLIQEKKVRSLKEFVEKCVKFGRNYTIDQWEPGISSIGPIRALILPKKMLDVIVQRVSNEEQPDVGRELGEFVQSFALFKNIDTAKPENWDEALRILTDFGLGKVEKTDDKVQVLHPAFSSEIMENLIETVLGVELKPMRMLLDVHLFQIIKKGS